MPAYHVERSVRILAPPSKVQPAIHNFAEWPKWSPWLCMEPTAKLNVYGSPGTEGHGYDWDGELVGSGGMKISTILDGVQSMDLTFLRPFKSKAKVQIEIQPVGDDETDVTWHMDGKMPFFLFFMIGMMKTMIGMDYARGLKMLKDYVETGCVESKTEIIGVVDVPESHYVGITAETPLEDIGASMNDTIPRAQALAQENKLTVTGEPAAIYDQMDLKQQHCRYTAIVPVEARAEVTGGGVSGSIQSCKAIKVIHTGSYKHLGNAWSTVMAYQRKHKMKALKTQHCFETYPTDPATTADAELVTEIFVPIRA